MSLKDKIILITGASRGIGLAIAKKCAKDGANIAILAKTDQPHPKLPGTLFTAAKEIEEAGGKALPIKTDVRSEEQVLDAVKKTVDSFGGIDICINNASAISLTATPDTEMKRYDLMHQVNVRATFMVSKACIPYLKQAKNPHILNNSPPLSMKEKWFAPHIAYSMSKYGMSMCVLGMAGELRESGVAVNAIWPKTAIATAAVEFALGGKEMLKMCRKESIMADAAYLVLNKDAKACSGHFFIDEDLLRDAGVSDFSTYKVDPTQELMPDFFVD